MIYQGYLKPGTEDRYLRAWKMVSAYFVEERGALGSTLHKTDEGMWLAYSRWPDRETRDASWSSQASLPPDIQEAIDSLKDCLDPDRGLPEITMELVEEATC